MLDLVLETRAGAVEFPLMAPGGAPRSGAAGGLVSTALEALEPRLRVRVAGRLVTTRELVLAAALLVVVVRVLRR